MTLPFLQKTTIVFPFALKTLPGQFLPSFYLQKGMIGHYEINLRRCLIQRNQFTPIEFLPCHMKIQIPWLKSTEVTQSSKTRPFILLLTIPLVVTMPIWNNMTGCQWQASMRDLPCKSAYCAPKHNVVLNLPSQFSQIPRYHCMQSFPYREISPQYNEKCISSQETP